jgi:hypothetical protein
LRADLESKLAGDRARACEAATASRPRLT